MIQKFYELSDGSGLKLSIAEIETKYYEKIHNIGISPDFFYSGNDIIEFAVDRLRENNNFK